MIGIFGGSFDPIHSGHIILAEDLIEKDLFERIIFVPANVSPLKNCFPEATFNDRIKMIKLATKAYSHIDVSDIEKDTNISYTIDTIRRLSKDTHNIGLIIGMDQAFQFPEWRSPNEILSLIPVYVLLRTTKEKSNNPYMKRFKVLKTRVIDISSTEIRQRVKEGKSIHLFVPEVVEEYIKKNHLYK